MLKKYKSKAFISSLLYLTAAYQSPAQLTGQFSLGGEQAAAPNGAAQPSAAAASNQKQITVVGLGLTPEAAEKQAITDAVRQAVGAFIDSNTIVQNEEVIKDRILSVSSGFVKEYKPAAPARKREDGLYEITIVATVESSKVVQALKEQNLISGEVAGQNLWAESSTKVMNAQDGVAMLEAKIPEFIKNSVTITPLGKDGKPQFVKDASGNEVPSTAPVSKIDDPATGKAKLMWAFEIGMDKKYYKESMLPTLLSCFNAIYGISPSLKDKKLDAFKYPNERDLYSKLSLEHIPFKSTLTCVNHLRDRGCFQIIEAFTRNIDFCKYYSYPPKDLVDAKVYCFLKIELLDSEGELISQSRTETWHPFHNFRAGFNERVVGPLYTDGNFYTLPIHAFAEIEMPIALLKEIKQVKVSLEVPDIKVSLKSANER